MFRFAFILLWCAIVYPILVVESSITIAMFILFGICITFVTFFMMLHENLGLHERISELDSRLDKLIIEELNDT